MTSKAKTSTEFTSIADLATHIIERSFLFNTDGTPCRAARTEQGSPNLVLVTGENASGKSLFARIAGATLSQEKVVPVSVSIRERTGAGSFDMSRMRQVMMFGDEEENSTGATSVRVISTAFKNLDHAEGSALLLDEPELGLSDGYARALGELIGSRSAAIPSPCIGVMVVTHSRSLVRGLLEGFNDTPVHVAVTADGTDPQPGLDTWLDEQETRSVDELLALTDLGHQRWRQLLDTIKAR